MPSFLRATSSLALLSVALSRVSASEPVTVGVPFGREGGGAIFPGLGEDPETALVPRLGQTITVPAGHPYLTRVSFWLNDSPVFQPQPTTFDSVLMAFGTDRPIGPPLHLTEAITTQGMTHGQRRRFDFDVGLTLEPLAKYVFFLDAAAYLDAVPNYATFASFGGDYYSKGNLVRTDFAGERHNVGEQARQVVEWDVAFRAEFAVIPEPDCSVILLIAVALALLWNRAKALRAVIRR